MQRVGRGYWLWAVHASDNRVVMFCPWAGCHQTGLNKTRVGEYLGRSGKTPEEKKFHEQLLDWYVRRGTAGRLASHLGLHRLVLVGVVTPSYLRLFDFSNSTFDVALRAFLSEFRMPGEGQVVDRFMNRFSAAFCEQHEGIFADPDAAYVLSYSMMMLNTTLHNPNVDVCVPCYHSPCGFWVSTSCSRVHVHVWVWLLQPQQRSTMTVEAFISMNRGINEGGDLPGHFLQDMCVNSMRELVAGHATRSVRSPIRRQVPKYREARNRVGSGDRCGDVFQPSEGRLVAQEGRRRSAVQVAPPVVPAERQLSVLLPGPHTRNQRRVPTRDLPSRRNHRPEDWL